MKSPSYYLEAIIKLEEEYEKATDTVHKERLLNKISNLEKLIKPLTLS